jgi:FKBP-type peptidyl-prolyl cis-trans isomerase (trigger factor)
MERLETELDQLLIQPQFAREVEGPDGEAARKELTRRLLSFIIQNEVLERYARAHDITVSSDEVDDELAREVERLGGQEAFDREVESQGLTLAAVRRNIERNVLSDKVRAAVLEEQGISPSDQAEEALRRWYAEQLAALDVEVNPRFGVLDPETGAIEAATST